MASFVMRNSSMILSLALHELKHGWKHFVVFVVCLVLGVTIIASVSSFSNIIGNSLQSQARSLLGGDIEVRLRGIDASKEQREFLQQYGNTSYITTLRSMLFSGEDATLVEIKAIDDAYPLVGDLIFNENIPRAQALTDNGLVVDSILLSQLGLSLGDEVTMGDASYIIRATLKKEPDRALQFFGFGPRVMLSHKALDRSGLVSTFGLVEHAYRIDTPDGVVADEAYEEQIQNELDAKFPDNTWRVRSGTDGNNAITRISSQFLSFLQLTGLATFLIAGIGIGSNARAYLEKKLATIAVFKTLGATKQTVLYVYLTTLALLTLIGGLVGVAIAMAIVLIALPLLIPVLPILAGYTLSPWPFLIALWYGVLITYLFSMPALLSALNTKPSLLFRSKMGALAFRFDRNVKIAVSYLTLLLLSTLMATATNAQLMVGMILVMGLAFMLFGLCTIVVRMAAKRIKVKTPWLKLALGNLHRPGSTTGTVIFAIGISLSVLIALIVTEVNFQKRITQLIEEDAPSLFMIDIQPHQKDELESILSEYASPDQILIYPMVRGRIAEINGEIAREEDVDADIRWAIRGDRGISTTSRLPENAKLAEGKWWPEDYNGPPLISVDERFMSGMGLSLGSTITLNILGEDITAIVASARAIDYSTMQINFSLMLSPGLLDEFPRTYISTIHLADKNNEAPLVRQINQRLPGVTMIRTTEVVELVREAVTHIGTALRITVAISLFAGILVLISALGATIEQRLYDTAVLKVLGARKADILKSCTTEWLLLALITSIIASVIGTYSAFLIGERFRATTFYVMPEVTLLTIIGCMALIWITGYLGNRRLFNLRPSNMLRNE